MKHEFTAIFEPGDDGWWIATCPEVPGTVGQGRTTDEAREDLASAVELMLTYLREEATKQLPPSAMQGVVRVG